MANTDTASPTLSTGTSLNGKESGAEHVVQGASASETAKDPPTTTTTPASPPSVSASNSVASASQPPSTAPRPSLVPLGTSQPSLSPASHPKKFSAVNVNKKFLEKTAQAASTTTSPASSASKSNPTVARPAVAHTLSHSRLVTAKLTASPIPSTAGWSRPASVAPTGSSSPNSASPLPTSAAPSNVASSAPQLPHVGKVIQPQPKAAAALAGSLGKDPFSGAKPVWGNVKPSGGSVRLDIPAEDFPTAAEAVKGTALSAKKPKSEDSQPSEAAKHAKEEADAFRGVHLDPNAHHWDEMEEDDDDFLGGVVEFDDGRQYKVESVDGGDRPPSAGGNVRDRDTDDFDRSWPKSRTSPLGSSRDLTSPTDTRSPTSSVNGLHPGTSPVESSRHLFNERLNRLEPYNHARAGPPLVSGRPHRDFSGPPPNILHKPPNDFPPRNRRFSGASTGSAAGPSVSPRDSQFPRRDGPPSSPRMSRDGGHLMAPSTSFGGRERPDASRRGNMGPPPVPPRALKTAQETGRQLPPHLTQNNAFRREPRPMNHEPPTPASSKAPSLPSHSPIATHAQLSTVSPLIGSVAGLPLPQGADLEEVRKDVMHTAATRAKQRREQEEAEREAQKERARKKAQELEERMNAAALEKERQEQKKKEAAEAEVKKAAPPPPVMFKQAAVVDTIIEEAVQSAKATSPEAKPAFPPFAETGRRPFAGPHRPAIVKTDSWRSAAPAPAVQQRRASSGFVASAHTALDAAVDTKEEDLEVVDFSDMDRLLGTSQQKPNEASEGPYATARAGRPVASDFFDEQRSTPEPAKEALSSWRRQVSTAQPEQPPSAWKDDGAAPDKDSSVPTATNDELKQTTEQTTPPSASSSRESLTSSNDVNGRNGSAGPPRTPRSQAFFKEATMSSLDDTMSRIKGAITHMKARDVPDRPEQYRESPYTRQPQQQGYLKPPRERWVPPALRQRHVGFLEDEDREVFDVTIVALPPSPPPSTFLVHLPKQSRIVEFILRKQLQAFHRPQGPARFELLSFDPPVEGMSKREFSVNDILFRKPAFFKGKPPKYRVLLPRRQPKGMLRGFGKTPVADTTASWRKPAVVAVEKPSEQSTAVATQGSGLNTMSRSPPPDVLPSETSTSLPKPTESTLGKGDSHSGPRARPQPKMPAGSAVAVRRPSGIDAIESTTNKPSSLNFIVSDELEDTREPAQTMEILSSDIPPPFVAPSHDSTSQPQTVLPDSTKPVAIPSAVPVVSTAPSQDPSSLPSTLGTKPSENTNTPGGSPFPPAHQTSPWSRSSLSVPPLKESTSRGPDPEHLKALWSQPPEKTELHPVNSLEAIPDDLTSLPFTLHEVKSEDGSTPPPAAAHPPSRMSLHDVTRAFQQVPQSSSATTAPPRPPISPPSTNAPVARPTTATYPYTSVSHPPNGMRPVHPYVSYPSPITSQSPAPMMYPSHPPPMNSSPIPARMQPAYGPSMWVPVMPPPGNAGNMMRPPPYATPSMVPYSPSPPAVSVYSPHPANMMQPHQQPAQNGAPANRNRNMGPGMSPALSQAPMYPPSPMMMHAHPPVMQHPQSHGYAPMPTGRGQPRTDNTNNPMGHRQPPPSSMPYPPASQAPFARSGW